jgi:PAS domain S-box-containing protein
MTKNVITQIFNFSFGRRLKHMYLKFHFLRKKNDANFQSLFIATPDNITITDLKGKIIDVSPSGIKMFGCDNLKSILGLSILDFIAPEDQTRAQQNITNMFGGIRKGPEEYSVFSKTKNKFIIEANAEFILGRNKKPHKIIFIIRDITYRKQTEEKLNLLIEAVTQCPVSIVITDKNGTIQYANPFCYKNTGYNANEIIGKNPRIFKSGLTSNDVYLQMWKTISGGNIWRGEIHNKKKDGSLYYEYASISPIKDNDGKISHFIGIKEDITLQKEYLNKLLENQQYLLQLNSQKDKFFSIIAHDLRSPLSSFLGLTELITNNTNNFTPDKIQKYMLTIKDSSVNLYNLLENLLEWARVQQGLLPFSPTIFNVKESINECLFSVYGNANTKNITINLFIDNDIQIKADKYMFQSIIRNLISNAVKFTTNNGFVNVNASIDELSNLKMKISDTGIGMSANMLRDLFQIDKNTSRKGTNGELSSGLGLLLCKEFVEIHKGKIWVESEIGQGSVFYFTINNNINNLNLTDNNLLYKRN